MLEAYNWPGNIRELRNVLEYAAIIVQDGLIRPEHLRLAPRQQTCAPGRETADAISYAVDIPIAKLSLGVMVDAFTEKVLERTLQYCNGNKTKAADLLQVNRKVYYR
jgi:DNA-binding NtrC family response regulator